MQKNDNYKRLYLWLMIPLVITLCGFSLSYFLRFAQMSWEQHAHGLSAMLWMLLLIVQPYIAVNKNNRSLHRNLGKLGILLAGIVAGTAISAIDNNIAFALKDGTPEPFKVFMYGVSIVDLFLVSGFIYLVAKAVLNTKDTREHSTYMIATALLLLSPGLTRLLVYIGALGFDLKIIPLHTLPIATATVLLASSWFMYRYNRLNHPAYYVILLVSLTAFAVPMMGESDWVREVMNGIFA